MVVGRLLDGKQYLCCRRWLRRSAKDAHVWRQKWEVKEPESVYKPLPFSLPPFIYIHTRVLSKSPGTKHDGAFPQKKGAPTLNDWCHCVLRLLYVLKGQLVSKYVSRKRGAGFTL
jgi:hypothetical protein